MKRSRDLIISQILFICTKGANKTKIVYQANLNFRTVDPYLKLLTEKGLINAKREPNLIYQTTEKGEELLGSLKAIQREIY
ncbi:MAG TPA: winged helix-turn-helix domain-containing protein [Methanothrix sp.]|jgi:predicted transcriptional regulator|uniref:winged helix-turn-helix domain-containing protein n=1 Tax=Methanothrix sp. TaxID=90426 RepID=UPI002D03C307|nr:winged helix-turn-helix domain-containing protein [Methanothrix sp.]MDI9418366.1 winged helix-turn-helix domain-containing protein [Euryarchaeota archaeon]HON35077.1 winged helix-turn-helix domain-containing protein [Methanothrix sp.]HRU75467.1 winged helix-turn-helix domain-containing protein [Methanothrix sp.]